MSALLNELRKETGMKLRPLHDWVIIKRDKPLESLLWIPDKPGNTGEVVALASGKGSRNRSENSVQSLCGA